MHPSHDSALAAAAPAAHSPGNLSARPIPQLNIAALTYVWSGQQGVNGEAACGPLAHSWRCASNQPACASTAALPSHPPLLIRLLSCPLRRPSTAGDVSNYASQLYPPLAYRPASAFEASPDLQQPHFSNCSVPLIMW